MFQFPGLPSPLLCVQRGDDGTPPVGFSHSGTPGSKAVCASPGPIAACRALRRLPAPRHPPCALHILPPPRGGAPCDLFRAFPCSTIRGCRDRERWNAPRGTTPLQILKCRCLLSLSDRKDRLKSDGESIFEIVPVPRRDVSRRFLLAMRLSRYAGRTPGTGYRGGAPGDS